MSKTYYEDELRYLRDVGPEFAQANPEIARLLSDRGTDPDVERLLEGAAFLCGRIREKLDDELPEFTAGIIALLWPHYLRSIPSMSVLEILPELAGMQAPLTVPAGAEFASIPIDGTSCRYRSAWPVVLRPWQLEDARLETEAARPHKLSLRFCTTSKVTLDELMLDRVRLHFAGDPGAAFALYLLTVGHTATVTVSNGLSGPKRTEMTLPSDCVRAAGLGSDEAVLPYPTRSFPGYRLFQEYFAFKERFLFVDIVGLDRAVIDLGLSTNIEVGITFNRNLETPPMISRDNVRLHCVPIINLFEHPADPMRVRHDRTSYLIQPASTGVADRRHVEVYSVDEVTGLVRGETIETRPYAAFYSFQHSEHDAAAGRFYYTRLTPGVGGGLRVGTDTYISFVPGREGSEIPAEETISIELTCTNRQLPQALRAGDIAQPTDTSPAGVRFRNLLKPSPTIPPPLGGGALQWRLISHMSLNYVTLLDANHFRELLRVYDFQSTHDAQRAQAHRRMLEGIIKLESKYAERLMLGACVRGTEVSIELSEDHFMGEGDAFLFAVLLDRFIGLYATINAFTQLSVRFSHTGEMHLFPARWGEQLSPAAARPETPYA